MSDIEKEIMRDNSRAAELRERQRRAFEASKKKATPSKPEPISDLNADAFVRQALRHGIDLKKIVQELAEEKAAKARGEESDS